MHYISLGYFCSIALELERLGLRTESSPFDWLISDCEGVFAAIENHFHNFLDYDSMSQSSRNRSHYKDLTYNMHFFHDFTPYLPLAKQIQDVKAKYQRRIDRFYKSITEPTLFIRYISDENKIGNISKELLWLEKNYDTVLKILKSFNSENDILFIANEGVTSSVFTIYNVAKDENDVVARKPIEKNSFLTHLFASIDTPEKQKNIDHYKKKVQKKKRNYLKRKISSFFKKLFLKEYIHNQQY